MRELSESEKRWLRSFVANEKRLVITGTDATGLDASAHVTRFPNCPGKAYDAVREQDFQHASPDSQQQFLDSLKAGDTIHIAAGPQVATSIARTPDGRIHCFFANFAGLRAGSNPVQTPQTGVEVTLRSKSGGKGFFLPFMGTPQPLEGVRKQDSTTFRLPPIEKGAVFSYAP